jgi:cell wall assembly regulator SMI1
MLVGLATGKHTSELITNEKCMEYDNEFENTAQTLTSDELDRVLGELGIDIPGDLKAHYLAYNGGNPKKYLFHDGDVIYVLQEFLPVKYASAGRRFEDVIHDLQDDLKRGCKVLPDYLIPFATDPGGDYYCISNRSEDLGSIFIFRGEHFDQPDRACKKLANSLREFIDEMTEEE